LLPTGRLRRGAALAHGGREAERAGGELLQAFQRKGFQRAQHACRVEAHPAPSLAVARQVPGRKRAVSGMRRRSSPGGMSRLLRTLTMEREERMVMRASRVAAKPSGPVMARRITPSPAPVARSVVLGSARAPVARRAESRAGPARASGPSTESVALTSPGGCSRLCSSTGKAASSPGARKRGSSASASTASRTGSGREAAPTRSALQATAISRSSPAKSGRSRGIMARPSASVSTTPENSATLRCGIRRAPSAAPSSPPWRSAATAASVGAMRRP
jgi:hypothetical protein